MLTNDQTMSYTGSTADRGVTIRSNFSRIFPWRQILPLSSHSAVLFLAVNNKPHLNQLPALFSVILYQCCIESPH